MKHRHHHHDHNPSAANILLAFILNLAFSIFELMGGLLTGSVAILSDAVHDLGDAASLGLSFFLEKKSRKQPDDTHTYGYLRYSVLGGLITTVILLAGSVSVIVNAVLRAIAPAEINYDGMILFAVVGTLVNLAGAMLTRHGESLNQRAVNLHLLEDVLGWAVVLAGAVVMRFTDWVILDPLMSIGVAVFILVHALGNLREVMDLFLEKTPRDIQISEMRTRLTALDGVEDVHHIHVRSLDGGRHYATLHVVADGEAHAVKESVRSELLALGIVHATIELETAEEACMAKECRVETVEAVGHHHHHHHHHGH